MKDIELPCKNCITFMMCKNRFFTSMKDSILIRKPDNSLSYSSSIIRGYVKTLYKCELLKNYINIVSENPDVYVQETNIVTHLIEIFSIKRQMLDDQLKIYKERGYLR